DSNTVVGQTLTANTPAAGTTVNSSGVCTDQAGNVADGANFGPVKIDKTKPVLDGSAVKGDAPDFTGATAYTAGSWTNKDVKVSFGCTDALSGVDSNTVVGQTVTATTPAAGTTVNSSGVCTDQAGNVADGANFGPVKIDKTKPVLDGSGVKGDAPDLTVATAYTAGSWTNKDVKVSFGCTDALSGVDSNTVVGQTLTANTPAAGTTVNSGAAYAQQGC